MIEVRRKLMKKLIIGLCLAVGLVSLAGCQWAAKNAGGSYTINLLEGEKLVNVTWKGGDIWYLTKPMTEEDVAETYEFKEDSAYGVDRKSVV